nr:CDP-alcohol phosphatidyltransferase family protein [Propionibacteriales bacterium]
NTLTLVRANLPVTGRGLGLGRWLGIFALTTDSVDGRLAHHTGTTTAFGRCAAPLADTAFWT